MVRPTREEVINFLSSYGVGSRDDAMRVAALLRNRGQGELAQKLLLYWAYFERDQLKPQPRRPVG